MLASKTARFHGAALLAAALLTGLAAAADDSAALSLPGSLAIDWPEQAVSAEMVLAQPDGTQTRFTLADAEATEAGAALFGDLELADGLYHYEVRFRPQTDESRQSELARARVDGQPAARVEGTLAAQSGSFRVLDGVPLFFQPLDDQAPAADIGGRDQVINDDLIVTGGACVGFDCADGEDLIWATIKIKANNPRLNFIDSSTGDFPGGDWQLRVNDTASGGADHFSIDWLGTDANTGVTPVTTPFRVDANAPNNALRITSAGRLGLGTATPALELQIANGDSPGMRLEQTNASGFTPQTWDLVGNEANFFVRDATNGSTLPFRIRPGAPTSSIDVQASGNVGLGTSSPAARLHVANGDLRVDGSVYQLSSRAVKTDFIRLDPTRLLDLVGGLDLGIWRYLSSADAAPHFGPAAEDFHSAFGLGGSEDSISIADMAGVALGAAQALKGELEARDAEIADLKGRLERLERALEAQLDQTER